MHDDYDDYDYSEDDQQGYINGYYENGGDIHEIMLGSLAIGLVISGVVVFASSLVGMVLTNNVGFVIKGLFCLAFCLVLGFIVPAKIHKLLNKSLVQDLSSLNHEVITEDE